MNDVTFRAEVSNPAVFKRFRVCISARRTTVMTEVVSDFIPSNEKNTTDIWVLQVFTDVFPLC